MWYSVGSCVGSSRKLSSKCKAGLTPPCGTDHVMQKSHAEEKV